MYYKKIAAIVLFGLTLTTCTTAAVGEIRPQTDSTKRSEISTSSIGFANKNELAKTMMEKEIARLEQLSINKNIINKALAKLKSHVGKTWYVFSGSTPGGWDCSGLTMWFYEQAGIQVEHRASKQDTSGILVNDPKPGDLVVFHYKGNKDAYHVGIYSSDGEMIHAPKHGHLTRIENIKAFGGNYSDITYRRLIKN